MTFFNSLTGSRMQLVFVCVILWSLGLIWTTPTLGQQSQLDTAMKIKPKHVNEVDFEQPGVAVLKDCKFVRTKSPNGFVVHHVSGRILRRFIDSDGNGKLDQWSYFKNGLEVYRDVDANKDGKLDQYRWLGPAGTRWGIDRNQDGQIDGWRIISPEEIAYECFQAIKNNDQERFDRLLLSETELKSLGLNEKIGSDVTARWRKAKTGFKDLVSNQSAISSTSKWVYAGNGQPAMMASGDGNQNDLIVYDHASGFFQNGSDTRQLALGSIVRIGDSWRMVELPEIVDPKKPLGNGGAFFPVADFGTTGVAINPVDKALAPWFDKLAKVDEQLESAKPSEVAKLEESKANILVQLYVNTKDPKTKIDWIQNLADSVSSAYQADRYDDGIAFLNSFIVKNKNAPGIDYVKWRAMFAEYGWYTKNGDEKRKEAARAKLIRELQAFQATYPKSEFAPDALVQLAVDSEVSTTDEPDKAIEWYERCAKRYANTEFGRRSKGAIVRLSSFGQRFPFKGKTASGKDFDLSSLRGKMVVLHYWETWCIQDDEIDTLAKLAKKYGDDVAIVGCNIESGSDATEKFKEFVKENAAKMTWVQLHQPGGVDSSPLAHQLGVALEPLIVLVDKEGKLIESNIGMDSLEREIERERRRKR